MVPGWPLVMEEGAGTSTLRIPRTVPTWRVSLPFLAIEFEEIFDLAQDAFELVSNGWDGFSGVKTRRRYLRASSWIWASLTLGGVVIVVENAGQDLEIALLNRQSGNHDMRERGRLRLHQALEAKRGSDFLGRGCAQSLQSVGIDYSPSPWNQC